MSSMHDHDSSRCVTCFACRLLVEGAALLAAVARQVSSSSHMQQLTAATEAYKRLKHETAVCFLLCTVQSGFAAGQQQPVQGIMHVLQEEQQMAGVASAYAVATCSLMLLSAIMPVLAPAVHNNSSGMGVGATAAPDIQTLPVGPAVLPATGGGRAAQAPRGYSMAIRSMQERQEYIQRQQRWLLFLRHCAKCQLDATECQFGCSCRVGRELWTHILQCSDPACNFSRCTSSKDLLKHHQKCQVC